MAKKKAVKVKSEIIKLPIPCLGRTQPPAPKAMPDGQLLSVEVYILPPQRKNPPYTHARHCRSDEQRLILIGNVSIKSCCKATSNMVFKKPYRFRAYL